MRRTKTFALSPYMRSMGILFVSAMGIGVAIMIWLASERGKNLDFSAALSTPDAFAACFLLVAFVLTISILLWNSFEYFGRMSITPEGLVFSALLRTRIVFQFSEIRDIGVDYVQLPQGRQFWIYFSKERLDHKYCHRINRLPFSEKSMRVEYSTKVYEALLEGLPDNHLKKKLCAAGSAVRHYK